MRNLLSCILLTSLLLSLLGCGANSAPAPTTEPIPTIAVVEGQPIEQLDNVQVYIPVQGESQALEGLPAYVYSEGASGNYNGSKEGRYDLNTHIFFDTDAASYITYLQALEKDGWEQYSNNIIEGTNLFATYTKDSGSLYCYYISSKNRTYIVTSPNQNLENRESDNQYQAVCTPLLTQIRLLCKKYLGGMSYLVRLSDGRFIVIDGGYNEDEFYHAKELYALMQEQNVLDKVTIAAWIITHPHHDHLGTASDFLRLYTPADVDIQQMIFNFPTNKDIAAVESSTANSDDPAYMPTFLLALDMLWPSLPITVCHTGQEYYFADAKIEFLHTLEDFYPASIATLSSNNVNGATAIFTVEIAGQRIMFLGDCALDESASMVKMWGDYLKSDIMQAAHHCQRGGTVALYEAIDPTVVLAPLPWQSITKRSILSYEATRWLWNNTSGNIREIILSGFIQRSLELPYTPAEDAEYFSGAFEDPWGGKADEYQINP